MYYQHFRKSISSNSELPRPLSRFFQRYFEDNASILGSSEILIPCSILQALVEYQELAPEDVIVRWTQEQELIFEGILGELRIESNNTNGIGK